MTKNEFLVALSNALEGIPDRDKAIAYYAEMIDDRIEDGMSETAATASMGNIDAIRTKIISETPIQSFIKEKASMPMNWVMILILIFGFPIWFSLLASACSVIFSLFAAAVAIIFALCAVLFAFAISGIALIIATPFVASTGAPNALFTLGTGLIMISLSILMFYPVM